MAAIALVVVAAAFLLWREALLGLSQLCLFDQRLTGHAAPCASVDAANGTVILALPDFHLLLTPTAPIAGIESAALQENTSKNYFALAWQARTLLHGAGGKPIPRDLIGLAVNSPQARTQDQLHIHVGCLRPDVAKALAGIADAAPTAWTKATVTLAGAHYHVVKLGSPDLTAADPFKLLQAGLPMLGGTLSDQTLVVAGATFGDGSPGFLLLASESTARFPAVGERLLDYQCRALASGGD